MNVKRFLKRQAQKDLQDLETDDDRKFLQRLKNSIVQQRKERKKEQFMNRANFWDKYFATWIIFIFIVCVTLFSFAIIDILRSQKPQEEQEKNVSTILYEQTIGELWKD